ncbi:MAG: sulfatase/phosphatase domain-containing protein, partial [Spirochaetota bacterium]
IPAGRTERRIAASIDLLPTIAALTGAAPPDPTTIDGVDLSGLFLGTAGASPRESFFYYHYNAIEAVRAGDWKLHLRKRDNQIDELYNLRDDPGERQNRFASEPARVAALMELVEAMRTDLGDDATGDAGTVRPAGRVEKGRTLTTFDPNHPYYIAEYDLADRG